MRGVTAHLKLWDQDLWLAEVASLRLGGALVVLSACDGAGTHALPGDEVLSLSWALLAAGAAGVLASLWPVNDQAAREFMELFYTALCNHGNAGRALAEAQRQTVADCARRRRRRAVAVGQLRADRHAPLAQW